MADRFDPPRAAWIARALKPLNPEDRPANPVAADQPLPTPAALSISRDESRVVDARAVDARVAEPWIVLGYKNGRLVVNVKGSAIPDVLLDRTGPSVTLDRRPMSINSAIDDGMKWMVDFDAAEKVGMGIRARLTQADAAAGLDFLTGDGHQGFA